jgi:hypothetical protein
MGLLYWGSFTGVKRQERVVEHSAPSGAEVKNECSCTSATAACLQCGQGKLYFTAVVVVYG